jgi:hypothetical protein
MNNIPSMSRTISCGDIVKSRLDCYFRRLNEITKSIEYSMLSKNEIAICIGANENGEILIYNIRNEKFGFVIPDCFDLFLVQE